MRLEFFEELRPHCPRCAADGRGQSPLTISETAEMRAGALWHGVLHCSDACCWAEFPVIDGVPVLVPDVAVYLSSQQAQVLARRDLPASLRGVVGDALGQGTSFDTDRQHVAIYGQSHYGDWTEDAGPSVLPGIVDRALALLPGREPGEGPALDLGCAVGRGTFVQARDGRRALGVDLNFTMLRLAQELLLEGRAWFDLRRIGLAYDPVEITLPSDAPRDRVDFWAADAIALPFGDATFARLGALNLVDSIAAPTNMLHEAARVARPGASAFFTTPFDWAESATERSAWMGGHSQRAPWAGRGEDVLRATLDQAGFEMVAEESGIPWPLRMHARSVMHYDLYMAICQRKAE